MRKIAGTTLIYSLVALTAVFQAAAHAQHAQAESVKWQSVFGHQKEFVIFIPSGFKTLVDDDVRNFGTGRSNFVTAKKTVKIARLINGALLLINYYEANGRALYEVLSASNKLSSVSDEPVRNFGIKRFGGKVRGQNVKTHYFVGKDRLYEATAYSRDEKDPIVEAFFASVRLADGSTYIAPNAGSDDESTPLPRIKEVELSRSSDGDRFDESQVDRDAIVLFQPGLRSSSDSGMMPQAGKVMATAVLSSSGKVESVKTSGTAGLDLQQAFGETIKKIIFIPADKDGKLVSVVKTFSWEMTIEVRRQVQIRDLP